MTRSEALEAMARGICCPNRVCAAGCEVARNDHAHQAQAALQALEEGGMVVVPREATEAMLKAAFVAMNETPSGTWKRMKAEGQTPRRLFDVKMAPRYRAMIAASQDQGSARDLAPSTEKARADGLAGPKFAWVHDGYECEVLQDGDWVAGAEAEGLCDVEAEARHYAAMYGQDGPVEVRIWERGRRRLANPQSSGAEG